MNKVHKLGTVAIGAVLMVLLGAGAASAQSVVDPTDGAYGDGVSAVQSFITDTAAGPLFALAAVVLGIMIGLRWLKRSKQAAS